MDLVLGIIALFVAMVASLYGRGIILRARRSNSNFVYKDLKVMTSEGSNPGLMVYLISILTAIIGPFSYRFYPLNDLSYVIMNIIAAIFFAVLYPPYAPVTGFATIDVIEREGVRFCIVGKVMNRKFRVLTITDKPRFEIVAESSRHRLVFEVTEKSSNQT